MPFGGNSSSLPCSEHAGTAAPGGAGREGGCLRQVGNKQSFSWNLPVETRPYFPRVTCLPLSSADLQVPSRSLSPYRLPNPSREREKCRVKSFLCSLCQVYRGQSLPEMEFRPNNHPHPHEHKQAGKRLLSHFCKTIRKKKKKKT